MFRLSNDEELTIEKLGEFINKHKWWIEHRYHPLMDAYMTRYPIFDLPQKPDYKPDKRIAVNFAKYITDTMNGFFIGIPIKIDCDDQNVAEYVEYLDQYNDQDDNNAELSKMCSIYGKGYEMYYVDDRGEIGITYLSPEDAFMIYDDSILERPRYFCRIYKDADDTMYVSVSDSRIVRYASMTGGLHWLPDEEKVHGFDGVPATEYRENEEEIGIFEPVLTMINEYNEAISEKANDVAYFADAYLKVLGALVDEESLEQIRQNRIINFPGNMDGNLDVDFLQKPDGDSSQEHLLDRLQTLIFQISMVANISDENFGSSSGIALKYKIQAMSNLALTKQRKFTSGMNRRYKLIFSNPVSGMKEDDWVKLNYTFTQNMPANLLEESQIAGNLAGIVSQQTQLSVLSCVDNVQQEIEQIKQDEEDALTDGYPMNRTAETTEVYDGRGNLLDTIRTPEGNQ
ncbi:MAG TPA: phage portal protein [Candidatus Mediterraneibacter pullistercoris]|nr:phage portal protein [Candidatus Mediterraneibacter pullistercoris]